MRELELDLGNYGKDGWTCEVIYRDDASYAGGENADTLDGARFAAVAHLTPGQRADLIASLVADLAAVARAEGHTAQSYLDGWCAYDPDGEFAAHVLDTARGTRAVLGRALALDEMRREQEADK